jgi:hypothetical protein
MIQTIGALFTGQCLHRLLDLSEEFEDLHIDILRAGRSAIIQPGWIHAVITPENSVLLNIGMVREDWISAAADGLAKEFKWLHSKMSIDNLNTVLDRRKRDVEMYTSLCSQEINQSRRAEIDQFLKVQRDAIAEIESIKKSKKRKR